MKIQRLKDVLAERNLSKIGSDKPVIIRIGKPENFPDSDDFFCPYQITGIGNEEIRYAGGIDAVQALILALKMIGADLYTSEEAKAGTLDWEGGERGDLGFPIPNSVRDTM